MPIRPILNERSFSLLNKHLVDSLRLRKAGRRLGRRVIAERELLAKAHLQIEGLSHGRGLQGAVIESRPPRLPQEVMHHLPGYAPSALAGSGSRHVEAGYPSMGAKEPGFRDFIREVCV